MGCLITCDHTLPPLYSDAGKVPENGQHYRDFIRKYRDPIDPSGSLIISPVPQPMSSTAYLALSARNLYMGETGRRLGDRVREHLRDVEKDNKKAFKPVARHFNLPNHSNKHWQSVAFPYIKEARKAEKH